MKTAISNIYEHPLFDELKLRLDTPAMTALREALLQQLWTGATGGVVLGHARSGKTTAIEQLGPELVMRDQRPIPYHHFTVPPRDRQTINSLCRSLCISTKHRITNHSKVEPMIDSVLHHFLDQCCRAQSDRFVLFVDEGQRLSLDQCRLFTEFYDVMRNPHRVLLTVFFVVNIDEAEHLLERVKSNAYAHIYGRFFHQLIAFHGLRSEADVRYCLKQYDQLRYPQGGPTYTEAFLPNAVKRGWRLASLSADLWRVYRDYQRRYHIPSWGMQYFVAAVNVLLTDYLSKKGPKAFNDKIVHNAIQVSGLIPSLVQVAS